MLKRLGLISIMIAASVGFAAPAFADKIVVGAYPANPPWEYKTDSGSFEGFEIDVAADVAKRIGADVEFQDLGFQALFAATASGRIDFAVSSISITNERLQNQAFTQPYYDSDGTIVGKADSTLTSLDDLKGKTIGVIAGSTGDAYMKENAEKLGVAEVKSYNAQQDLLLEVQNGRIDGGAGELAGFQFAIQKMPALKVLVRIPTGERFAMMTKKGHPMLEKVNGAITEMKTDGTLAAIHKKWFGVDPEAGTSTVKPSEIPQVQ
jgi:polar amino acid transport system substrate-binding protein